MMDGKAVVFPNTTTGSQPKGGRKGEPGLRGVCCTYLDHTKVKGTVLNRV